MPNRYRVYLESDDPNAALLAILRRHLSDPISALRTAVRVRQPVVDESPHHNEYSAFIARVSGLLDDLDAERIRYRVEIDGATESPQYLRATFQRWQDIGEEVRYMADLESGEPCIATLEWLKRTSPPDVFQQTIKQIIDRNGYDCDEDVVEWARRECKGA